MINKAKRIMLHPLFSGSMVMIVGSNFANFVAYIYHLVVGRLLGPSAYGELSTVISLLGLIFAAFTFFGLVIVKFVSSAEKNDYATILSWFVKKAAKFGVVMSLAMFLLSPVLSKFLHINILIFIILSAVFYFGVLGFVYRSFMQGILSFREVVIANNLDVGSRLILGLIFIYLGWSVAGAVFGIVLAIFISYLYLRRYVLKYHKEKVPKEFKEVQKVFRYTIPIVVASFATNSLFATDVILVKHYFSAHDAGIYASLSTLGKLIFYGAGPVGAVMFPMVSRRYSQKKTYTKIFFLALLLTSGISLFVIAIYKFFPILSIKILYGNSFTEGARYLFWFGVFMTVFTIASLVINLFLSIEKTKVVFVVVAAAMLQIIGILIFHKTILDVIFVSITASSLMLVVLLLYFAYDIQKK